MQLVTCKDIQLEIVLYINNIKDLISWKNICKSTYNVQHTANFICDFFVNDIIIKKIDLSSYMVYSNFNSKIKIFGHNITYLVVMPTILNEHFKYIPNLIYLDCFNNYNITDIAVPYLSNLKYLLCGRSDFTDDSFKQLPNLTYLDCGHNTSLTNMAFNSLSNLKYLACGICYFTDVALYQLPELIQLNCEYCTDFTNYGLKRLSKLMYLDCGRSNAFTDSSIGSLTNLIHLECGVSENIKLHVSMKNLTYLHCGESINIDNKSMQLLPNLTHLLCGWNKKITDTGISSLKNLIYLHCGWNTSITKCPVTLKYLTCGFNTNITDESFEYNSELLYLHCSTIKVYITLNKLKKLKYLYLHNEICDINLPTTIEHIYYDHISAFEKLSIKCIDCICCIPFK